MKTSNKIIIGLSIVIIILLYLLLSKPEKNTIIIPSESGSFDNRVPIQLPGDTLYKDTIVYKDKQVMVENPVNKKLAREYLKAISENDSLKALNLYLSAVQIRKYKEVFEDKNVKTTVYAQTTGTLDSLRLEYDRKEIEVDIPRKKEAYVSLLGGVNVENNINTLSPVLGVNVGVQLKENDIFLLGINKNQTISASYIKNIFTIKK